MIYEDKTNNKKENVKKNFKNPRSIWKIAKDILYGKNNRQPERIIENYKLIMRSQNVLNNVNRHFIRKISEIEEKIYQKPL